MKQGKCFLVNFERSFQSWDNQILTFDIQILWHDEMLNHETQNTYYWINWEVNTF